MRNFILISCNSQDPYSETQVMTLFTHRPILLNRWVSLKDDFFLCMTMQTEP